MQMRTKKILWGVLGLLALLFMFVFGAYRGNRNTIRAFVEHDEKLALFNDYGKFITDQELSTAIAEGRIAEVKCGIDLEASSLYDKFKKCQSNRECRAILNKQRGEEAAAKFIDEKPAGFKYYDDNDGARLCNKAHEVN